MPPQLSPTAIGIIANDWTHSAGSEDYGAHRILDGSGNVIGQVLTVPSGYGHANFSARAGQEGWKWSGTAFPSTFTLDPCGSGFSGSLAATPTWYQDNALASISLPPTAPAAGSTIWRINKTDGTLVGYLVRPSAAGCLRWVVKDNQLSGNKLPNVDLVFTTTSWPGGTWTGNWSGTLDLQVP